MLISMIHLLIIKIKFKLFKKKNIMYIYIYIYTYIYHLRLVYLIQQLYYKKYIFWGKIY